MFGDKLACLSKQNVCPLFGFTAVPFRVNTMFFVSIGFLPSLVKLTWLVRNVFVMSWAFEHLPGINVSLRNVKVCIHNISIKKSISLLLNY